MKAACFWWKMSKIKNKLYYRCLFFFHFFWFLSPKHTSLMHIWFFFCWKKHAWERRVFYEKSQKPTRYQWQPTDFSAPSCQVLNTTNSWKFDTTFITNTSPHRSLPPPKRPLGTWLKTLFIILRRRLVEFLVFNSISHVIKNAAWPGSCRTGSYIKIYEKSTSLWHFLDEIPIVSFNVKYAGVTLEGNTSGLSDELLVCVIMSVLNFYACT